MPVSLTFHVSLKYRVWYPILATSLSDCKPNDTTADNQDMHRPLPSDDLVRRVDGHYDAIKNTTSNTSNVTASKIKI